ncbi:delta(14)-sterol reductase TM7SF2-like isoform X2 [Panulirus ornatus]
MAKFEINDRVMARWPKSSLWFEGTVVDLNDIEYQIRFDDPGNSEYVIKFRDVKSLTGFRKRSKSRGRSRSRGRSSGRRKSQGRSSKVEPEPEPVRVEEPEPEPIKILDAAPVIDRRNDTPEPVPIARLSRADLYFAPRTSTPSSESALTTAMNDKELSHTSFTPLPSAHLKRNQAITEIEADGQMNNVETVTTSEVAPASPSSRLCGLTCSIGSCIKSGVLALIPSLATLKTIALIVILILLPFYLTEMCTKSKCTVMDIPAIPRKLQYYYDPLAISIVAGFLVAQLLLYFIPIGRVVKTRSGVTVHDNGFIALLLSLAVVPIMLYLGYDVLVVYSKYRQLQTTSIVLALILAIAMYIRAGYIPDDAKNPFGNSGIFLPDFFTGREITPVIGSVDLKFFLFRNAFLSLILINVIVIVKHLQPNPDHYSPTLLLACSLQIFYAGDFVWFEEAYFTTYDYMRHGFGLLYLHGSLLGPFILTVFTRLVLNHRTELEWYYLSLIAALNLVGYTILRGSNSQKHAFRANPSNPALAHLESLPTPAGKRLLVSGWWGVMRHPNYLGDILIFTSWALLCGFNHALPWILVALDALFLVGRIFETENLCRRNYGTAWDSYTERVKYRLIPKVF